MGRELDMEKEFSENIDRMLAGEEIKVSAGMDDDCRTALDFTQELARLCAVPSPFFKAELKEKLLQKLSEEESRAEAKRGRFWESLRRLVPRQPVWQALTALLVVVVVAGGITWGMGTLKVSGPPPCPMPAPTPAPQPPQSSLELEAIPLSPIEYAPGVFLPGEEVKIEFRFSNASSEPITVAPFPPGIEIVRPKTDEDGVVRSFAKGSGQLDMSPVETVEYTLVWDQKDDNGKQVVPGWYYVDVKGITVTKATAPTRTGVSFGSIAKLLIQFPQGAMEKIIEVNQSQTVNDLTITLERVGLSATGVRFYAFTIPPGYSPPEIQGSDTPPHKLPYLGPMYPVRATYTVDGITKNAGWAGLGAQGDGIRLSWDEIDPLPSGARELTFTITSFGDLSGPWEFFIPLEP